MYTSHGGIFRNSEADFEEYSNDEIEFRIISIGSDEPDKRTISDSLRRAVGEHLDKMISETDLNHIAVDIHVYTKEGRYLADTKADIKGFRMAEEKESARFTRELYQEFGDLIPCMQESVPSGD